jgi:hypothetical protein
MVNNTQNYRVFGLCPSSGVLKTREYNVSELDLFPFSGEGETPTLLDPLERANLSHWRLALSKEPKTTYVSPSPEDGNKTSFRNAVFSSI